LNLEKNAKDLLEPLNKPFEGIENEIEKDVDNVVEDVFPDAKNWED